MTILIPCACLVFAVTLAFTGKLWDRKPGRRGYYLRLLAYRLGWRKGYCGPHERVTLTERELKVLASVIEVVRRYPMADVVGNDVADALVLAAMGADHLGHPLATVPQAHRAALGGIAWPTLTTT